LQSVHLPDGSYPRACTDKPPGGRRRRGRDGRDDRIPDAAIGSEGVLGQGGGRPGPAGRLAGRARAGPGRLPGWRRPSRSGSSSRAALMP